MTDRPAIKPLVWGKTSYGTPEVNTVVGVYRLNRAGDGGWRVSVKSEVLFDSDGRTNFATIEAAKAAAQADYEARIRSCLLDKPEAVEGDGAWDGGPLTISYPVHEIAHNLLFAHIGSEGGCPRIDWYKLRAEISDAIAVALDNQRRLDMRPADTDAAQCARRKAFEEAAKLIEANIVKDSSAGKFLAPRQEGNRDGLHYAAAIRHLAEEEAR